MTLDRSPNTGFGADLLIYPTQVLTQRTKGTLCRENIQKFSCGMHGLSVEKTHEIQEAMNIEKKVTVLSVETIYNLSLKHVSKNDTHQFSLYVKISSLCNYCSKNTGNTTQECMPQSKHSASQYVVMCLSLSTDATGMPFQRIPILITDCFIKKKGTNLNPSCC